MRNINFLVDEEMHEKVRKMAFKKYMTISEFMRELVTKELKRKK